MKYHGTNHKKHAQKSRTMANKRRLPGSDPSPSSPSNGGGGDVPFPPPRPSPPIGRPYSVLAPGRPFPPRPPHPKVGDLPALDLLDSPSRPADLLSIPAATGGEHQHLVGVASLAIKEHPATGV